MPTSSCTATTKLYRKCIALPSANCKNKSLKLYEKLPHGMPTTHADVINADLLAFIKSR